MSSLSLPNDSNIIQEIPRELLENPENGLSAAKPLKEDNQYYIFNDGRLYSLKTKKFLKGKIDNVGYRVYRLAIYNELTGKMGKMLYAHRLVAEYFIENNDPKNKIYVHHKDENKLNNNINNLEWVSSQENYKEYLKNHKRKSVSAKYKIFNLDNEIWKIIPFNPLYSVSNKGRVINNKTNRLLTIDTHQKYSRISLNDKKHYYIHRLVYCVFNNDYDLKDMVIDHIDANPRNNSLDNLQKISFSENNLKRGKSNDYLTMRVESSDSKREAPVKQDEDIV